MKEDSSAERKAQRSMIDEEAASPRRKVQRTVIDEDEREQRKKRGILYTIPFLAVIID